MKGKDYFAKLKEQGKITKEDYDKFLEGVPEFEVPDSIFQLLENTFITTDRAAAHPDVARRLRADHLDPVNRDLTKILGVLDKHDKYTSSEIAKLIKVVGEGDKTREIPDTYKQLEALTNALPKLFDKLKIAPNDEETKKTIADKEKVIQELTEKFTLSEKEKEGRIKQIQDEYTKKYHDDKVQTLLESMVNSYTFADGYTETKPTLTKAMLAELKASNHLALAAKENGETSIEVQELKDGVLRPKFDGNTPVTINSLLDKTFKPFLKVNNAGDGGDHSDKGSGQASNPKSFTVNDGKQAPRQGANVSVTI